MLTLCKTQFENYSIRINAVLVKESVFFRDSFLGSHFLSESARYIKSCGGWGGCGESKILRGGRERGHSPPLSIPFL